MNKAAIGEKKSPGVSASIGGENHLRFSLAIKFAANVVQNARCVASLRRIASYVGWQYLIVCFGVLKFPQDQKTS